jgi:ribonuclease BN (tRNA processing enzyme)
VKVTFAGSGDAFGSGGRFQACILLQDDARPPMLLDCGATSLVALKRQRINPSEIAAVFVTHLFVDHFGGVPHLILDGQFSRRTQPLVIAGPIGTETRLMQAMEVMFPGSSTATRRFAVNVVELSGDTQPVSVDDVVVRAWEVNPEMEGGPFLALRVTFGDRTVAYTGDTAWTDAIAEVADKADLLIAESYFWDKPVPFHLRYADVVTHRDKLTAARIVLTHMSSEMLSHVEEADFEVAHDGLTLEL